MALSCAVESIKKDLTHLRNLLEIFNNNLHQIVQIYLFLLPMSLECMVLPQLSCPTDPKSHTCHIILPLQQNAPTIVKCTDQLPLDIITQLDDDHESITFLYSSQTKSSAACCLQVDCFDMTTAPPNGQFPTLS